MLFLDIGATNLRIYYNKKIRKVSSKNLLEELSLLKKLKAEKYLIAVAGKVDYKNRSAYIPNLNLKIDFKKFFPKDKLFVVNDAISAAIAEKFLGYGKGYENFVYLTWSTGIGCGVFVNNKLLLGKDGNAHEIGHTVIDYNLKLRCNCGKYGHLEAYCSGKNIPNFVKLLSKTYNFSFSKYLEVPKLFKLYKKDKIANFIIKEIVKVFSCGVSNLISLYDPELIVFGGGIILNNKFLLKLIEKEVKKLSFNRTPKMKITKFGDLVVLKGLEVIEKENLHNLFV